MSDLGLVGVRNTEDFKKLQKELQKKLGAVYTSTASDSP